MGGGGSFYCAPRELTWGVTGADTFVMARVPACATAPASIFRAPSSCEAAPAALVRG